MSDELPESPESMAAAQRQTVILLAVFVEGGLLAGASFLGWILDQPPLRHFAWTPQGTLWGIAATVPVVALFFVFLRWPVGPLSRIHKFSEEVIRPLLAPCSLIDLLGISVLAGLGEELLFRGVLQVAFARWFGLWAGVIVANLLFGVMHSITVAYAVLAAVMGAYLSCVFLYVDNLLAVVLTHALYDFIVLVWLLRGPGAAEALAARESADQ